MPNLPIFCAKFLCVWKTEFADTMLVAPRAAARLRSCLDPPCLAVDLVVRGVGVADQSPPSCSGVKSEWRYTSTPYMLSWRCGDGRFENSIGTDHERVVGVVFDLR